jgi:hypothetical protein
LHITSGRAKRPSAQAIEYAQDVARRIRGRRAAPVRNEFIERMDPSTQPPPLARLLRGGQGGEVRLKLYLSMLWFAVGRSHETAYPARGWAALLDLPEPETNGARRVSAAIEWLQANHLVRVERQPGTPSVVYLLDERGNGEPYTLPFRALEAKEEAGEPLDRADYWVSLPAEFWTKGWLAVLTAPATAMLLVMMDESAASKKTTRLWHSPNQAARRFGFSQDVRSAGLRELAAYGLVTLHRIPISSGVFDFRRMRNAYDLHLEQLLVEPGQERPEATTLDVEAINKEAEAIDVEIINSKS